MVGVEANWGVPFEFWGFDDVTRLQLWAAVGDLVSLMCCPVF